MEEDHSNSDLLDLLHDVVSLRALAKELDVSGSCKSTTLITIEKHMEDLYVRGEAIVRKGAKGECQMLCVWEFLSLRNRMELLYNIWESLTEQDSPKYMSALKTCAMECCTQPLKKESGLRSTYGKIKKCFDFCRVLAFATGWFYLEPLEQHIERASKDFWLDVEDEMNAWLKICCIGEAEHETLRLKYRRFFSFCEEFCVIFSRDYLNSKKEVVAAFFMEQMIVLQRAFSGTETIPLKQVVNIMNTFFHFKDDIAEDIVQEYAKELSNFAARCSETLKSSCGSVSEDCVFLRLFFELWDEWSRLRVLRAECKMIEKLVYDAMKRLSEFLVTQGELMRDRLMTVGLGVSDIFEILQALKKFHLWQQLPSFRLLEPLWELHKKKIESSYLSSADAVVSHCKNLEIGLSSHAKMEQIRKNVKVIEGLNTLMTLINYLVGLKEVVQNSIAILMDPILEIVQWIKKASKENSGARLQLRRSSFGCQRVRRLKEEKKVADDKEQHFVEKDVWKVDLEFIRKSKAFFEICAEILPKCEMEEGTRVIDEYVRNRKEALNGLVASDLEKLRSFEEESLNRLLDILEEHASFSRKAEKDKYVAQVVESIYPQVTELIDAEVRKLRCLFERDMNNLLCSQQLDTLKTLIERLVFFVKLDTYATTSKTRLWKELIAKFETEFSSEVVRYLGYCDDLFQKRNFEQLRNEMLNNPITLAHFKKNLIFRVSEMLETLDQILMSSSSCISSRHFERLSPLIHDVERAKCLDEMLGGLIEKHLYFSKIEQCYEELRAYAVDCIEQQLHIAKSINATRNLFIYCEMFVRVGSLNISCLKIAEDLKTEAQDLPEKWIEQFKSNSIRSWESLHPCIVSQAIKVADVKKSAEFDALILKRVKSEAEDDVVISLLHVLPKGVRKQFSGCKICNSNLRREPSDLDKLIQLYEKGILKENEFIAEVKKL